MCVPLAVTGGDGSGGLARLPVSCVVGEVGCGVAGLCAWIRGVRFRQRGEDDGFAAVEATDYLLVDHLGGGSAGADEAGLDELGEHGSSRSWGRRCTRTLEARVVPELLERSRPRQMPGTMSAVCGMNAWGWQILTSLGWPRGGAVSGAAVAAG